MVRRLKIFSVLDSALVLSKTAYLNGLEVGHRYIKMSSHLPPELDALVGLGRYSEALKLLLSARSVRIDHPALFDTYEAELSYEVGQESRAESIAKQCLEHAASPALAGPLHRVLAVCAFSKGSMAIADAHLALAQTLCEPRSRQAALSHLTRLAFDIQLEPLVTVLARMPHVRKAVAVSGDPHVLALLRIYVARCEARASGLPEARRHHHLVSELLKRYPNEWLEGLLEVDR